MSRHRLRSSLASMGIALVLAACAPDDADVAEGPTRATATFVGRSACGACHADEHTAWTGSHHDLAMQQVSAQTVLGDFDDASFTLHGVTSTFTRRDGSFVVRTEGDGGRLQDFEVAYVFGVDPLQQYLVAFPDGRYQVLPLCWDTRPEDVGGQRWFHLSGQERIPPGDALFWTGPAMNWNAMCADCHSTRLRRGYDAASDRYETTWSEIDVSCEACHGPGSEHVAWAQRRAERNEPAPFFGEDDPKGLLVTLRAPQPGAWVIDPDTGIAERDHAQADRAELDTCARCHARRTPLRIDHAHGRPFLDSHRLALVEEGLYHADGQVREEVYVYGSFLQSRMHAAGVTCSDCHDAHTLELHRPGNELCAQCHLPAKFDTREHHFHEPGTAGAGCVDCHMPASTYMQIDARRDHSLRVPRPDLTIATGAPNACNGCHTDETPHWAESHLDDWYGEDRERGLHLGHALHAARTRHPDALRLLAAIANDPEASAIGRASSLAALRALPDRAAFELLGEHLEDADPLVRHAAVAALDAFSPPMRAVARPLLDDDVLVVRAEAARVLAAAPRDAWPAAQRARFEAVFEEFVATERASAGSAAAHVHLGLAFTDRGWFDRAEAAYRTAMRLSPHFVPAPANLADLYRLQEREEDAERVLRAAIERHPEAAVLHHALGLVLVRRRDVDAAVRSLHTAARLAPDTTRYAYVHAIALSSSGDLTAAIAVLEQAHERDPNDVDVLLALATTNRDAGKLDDALRWARTLSDLVPEAAGPRQLLEELRAAADRR